ncbi:MAG: SDR family oxidoreductase [Moorea sp. SIO1G6]|uniref:SDR family oxidoreductase n=1 Tax=unclassified Moorena TaxID=2683338 RepID=UPI0013B701FF|nr:MULTISPECIES: SDR family oxidoreductase [unclassified Moorena]NEP48711.1 SDR family oxidoreductase [Moorena sp. SIO3C2]NEQ09679.1 SDR family oxidoreductase [Moorena sp. SIO4E2]NET68795.1 SDR family oxidoreductase [Moorena sp. SIO1G6]
MKGSVVITGASSGIGEACAIYLDKLGYQVFAGVRREADGEALKRKTQERVIPIMLDVTDESSIKTSVKTVQLSLESHGLTALVNNAGIVTAGPLEFLPISELRKQLEVNVLGQIAVTQAFLPLLRKSKGRVINIGSDYGKVSAPLLGPYCASKFALEALTDALRMELQPWKIAVSLLEVGTVKTPIWKKSIEQTDQIWECFPDQAKKLYFPTLESVKITASQLEQKGLATEIVAKAVSVALIEKRPKTRYVVGLDAKINILLSKLLPDWVLDRLITWYLGLTTNLINLEGKTTL